MQYLLLITGDLSQPTSQAEIDRVMGEYWEYDKAVAETTSRCAAGRVAAPLVA